ncbi:molybdenum ABC transporter ATP-binding protein [SAR202 cluster bacterium AC-409-J13_OGT_754m]|nr:molybdenum ABC transporter ATP-binding protein [SAR202 cluster bacterium AC-409-J13_OGT_754m]
MNEFLNFNFSKSYPDFELRTSGSFPHGIIAIFGPSGSGKTTFLNCIAGLINPDIGEIRLNQKLLFSTNAKTNLSPDKRRIGYMFQENLLFPHLTVEQNILYGYRLTKPEERRIDPEHIVDLLEIRPLLNRNTEGLSMGEQQRIVLARALSTSPHLLLLDEPLGSLHASMKASIILHLEYIYKELQIPIIYVSHSLSEVLKISDYTMVMNQGNQLFFSATKNLLEHPELSSIISPGTIQNIFEATIIEHRAIHGITMVQIGATVLAVPYIQEPTGEATSISISASDILIALEKPQNISARNILITKIEKIDSLGSTILIHTNSDPSLKVEITSDALNEMKLSVGIEVYLIIKSNSITLMD